MEFKITSEEVYNFLIEKRSEYLKISGEEETKETPEKSDKVRKLEDLLNRKVFGCNTKAVSELLTILLDTPVEYKEEDFGEKSTSEYPNGLLLINGNGDRYYDYDGDFKDKEVLLSFYKSDDDTYPFGVGDSKVEELSNEANIYTIASEEEIKEFSETIFTDHISKLGYLLTAMTI